MIDFFIIGIYLTKQPRHDDIISIKVNNIKKIEIPANLIWNIPNHSYIDEDAAIHIKNYDKVEVLLNNKPAPNWIYLCRLKRQSNDYASKMLDKIEADNFNIFRS